MSERHLFVYQTNLIPSLESCKAFIFSTTVRMTSAGGSRIEGPPWTPAERQPRGSTTGWPAARSTLAAPTLDRLLELLPEVESVRDVGKRRGA